MAWDYAKGHTTVWVLNGLRQPAPVPAQVKVTEKSPLGYAVLMDGTIRFMGRTAFFTEEAARKRWAGEADRVSKNSYTKFKYPDRAQRAAAIAKKEGANVYRGSRIGEPPKREFEKPRRPKP